MEHWPDGSKYEGEYKAGNKHGRGKFTWPDGTVYNGTIYNNDLNGTGCY